MSTVLCAQKPHQFDPILLAFLRILCAEVRFVLRLEQIYAINVSGRRERTLNGGVER